ncbi:hypothetical protein [Microbacterium hibisci]|uniref:hypothetical protein n=1 Tax=Microbacterium hibisci TaxID=2036000 RepID=UPI0019433F37|nr:hypothetical protein [Microbacterium hibisci]
MQHAIVALITAPTPTPTPTMEVDPDLVTPGVWGFVITALVAVAVIFLVWDMMRRIRRGRVRADIQEELDAEAQAARAVEATDVDDQSIDPEDGRGQGGGSTPPRG